MKDQEEKELIHLSDFWKTLWEYLDSTINSAE